MSSSTQNAQASEFSNIDLNGYVRGEHTPPIKDDDTFDTRPLTRKTKTYVVDVILLLEKMSYKISLFVLSYTITRGTILE